MATSSSSTQKGFAVTCDSEVKNIAIRANGGAGGCSGNTNVFSGSGNTNVFSGSGNTNVFSGSGNTNVFSGSGNTNVFSGSGKKTPNWLVSLQKARKRTRAMSVSPFQIGAKRLPRTDRNGGGDGSDAEEKEKKKEEDGVEPTSLIDEEGKAVRTTKKKRVAKQPTKRRMSNPASEKPKGRKPSGDESRQKIELAIQEIKPPRFDLTDPADRDRGMAYLEIEGYVVWSNVIPPEQIAEHIGRLWNYIETACPGVLRSDPKTWTNIRWPSVLAMFIFRFHGIGQSDFMWHIRTLPLVRVFFEEHFRKLERFPASLISSPLSTHFPVYSIVMPSSSSSSSSPSSPTPTSTSSSNFLKPIAVPTSSRATLTPTSPSPSSSALVSASTSVSTSFSASRTSSSFLVATHTTLSSSSLPLSSSSSSTLVVRSDMALATSFDGCSVLRGAEHKQPFTKSWLHVDENLAQTRHIDYSVQCAVNLVGGRPITHGAFVCVPRSHTHYKRLYADMKARTKDGVASTATAATTETGPEGKTEIKSETGSADTEIKQFTASKSHYLPLPSASCAMLRPFRDSNGAIKAVALTVDAGDMVSWMSTLTHANTPPTVKPSKTSVKKSKDVDKKQKTAYSSPTESGQVVVNALRRIAAFVSMYPKDKLAGYQADPKKWTARRQAACAAAFTAGHNPVNPSENNICRRGRHPSFSPVVTPIACQKTIFAPAERDLL
jgi:hypothetical protein